MIRISRRVLLFAPFLLSSRDLWAKAPKPDAGGLRVFYNDDITHLASLASPFHRFKEEVTEEEIRADVNQAIDAGVDVFVTQPGTGWVPYWKSQVYPPVEHFKWVAKTYNAAPFGVDKFVAAGGDVVDTVLRQCRARGVAMHVSFRLNDEHAIEFSGRSLDEINKYLHDSGTPEWQRTLPIAISRVHADNPQWRFDANSRKPEDLIWNWSHPEAVAHKLALVSELVRNYDVDGLELDYMRFPRYFDSRTPLGERAAIMAKFIGDVRSALDAGRAGRELTVRVPPMTAALAALGLNLATLRKLGVNRVNVSSHTFTNQDIDFQGFRKQARGLALTLELAQAKHFLQRQKPRRPGDDLMVLCSDRDDVTTAWLAQAHGFDGVSLFNFVYYRRYGKDQPGRDDSHEPPFDVIARLKQPAASLKPEQSWFLGTVFTQGFEPYAQMPARIRAGSSVALKMQVALPKGAPVSRALLRFIAREGNTDASTARFSVSLNGAPLTRTVEANALGSPEDAGLPFVALDAPPDLIVEGTNVVRIEQADGAPAVIALLELLTRT